MPRSGPPVDAEEVEEDELADENSAVRELRSFCNAVNAALTLVVLDDVVLQVEFEVELTLALGGTGGEPLACACNAPKSDVKSFQNVPKSEPIVEVDEVEEVEEAELAGEKSAKRVLRSFCNAVSAALTLVEPDDVALDVESEAELALAPGGGGGGTPAPCACRAPKSDVKSSWNLARSELAVDVEDELADEKSAARVLRSLCSAETAVLTLVELDDVALALAPGGGGGGTPAPCACKAAKSDPRSFWNVAKSVVDVEEVEEDELAEEESAARVLRSLCSAESAALTLVELDDVALHVELEAAPPPAPAAVRPKSELRNG